MRAGHQHRRAGALVAGRLDPDFVARRQQQLRQQVQRLLRTRGDDDLLRRADHAARGAQVGAQQLAQRGIAVGGTIAKVGAAVRMAQVARFQLAPQVEGEQVQARHAGAEGAHRAFVKAPRSHGVRQQRAAFRQCTQQSRRRRRLARQRQGCVDEGALPHAAAQIAFAGELVVGRQHGLARHAELPAQVARGRQARAGRQRAVQDRVLQTGVQLAKQRHVAAAIERRAGDQVMDMHGGRRRIGLPIFHGIGYFSKPKQGLR